MIGDRVYSYNETTHCIELQPVIWAGKTGFENVQLIKLNRHTSIKATKNHPFYSARIDRNGWSGEFLGSRELTQEVTHAIVAHSLENSFTIEDAPEGVTLDAMQFFGAWMGDGCFNLDRQIVMSMPVTDRVHDVYVTLSKKVFIKKLRRSTGSNLESQEEYGPAETHVNGRSFRIGSVLGYKWMHELGFVGGVYNKRIPSWVFKTSREFRMAFLAGLIDSDGYISENGNLSFALANRMLVEDIYFLLITLGIKPGGLTYERRKNPFYIEDPKPSRKEFCDKWSLVANMTRNWLEIPIKDELYKSRLQLIITNYHSRKYNRLLNLPLELAPKFIQSIREENGAQDVYNLTIANNENYFANGILVHNCSYHSWAHNLAIYYDGTISIGHSWHASSEIGSAADQQFPISREIFRKACDNHRIPHD